MFSSPFLFSVSCFLAFASARNIPINDNPPPVTANPTVSAAIQAIKNFVNDRNILKITQLFAASSSEAKSLIYALQDVRTRAYLCIYDNDDSYIPIMDGGNDTFVTVLRSLADGPCSGYKTDLINLASAFESTNYTALIEGLNVTVSLPDPFGLRYERILRLYAQFGFSSDFQMGDEAEIVNATIDLFRAFLNADNKTLETLVGRREFLNEILLPNGSYHSYLRSYLQETINAVTADRNVLNQTAFVESSMKIQEYQLRILPEFLAYAQAELDNSNVPITIQQDFKVTKVALLVEILAAELDGFLFNTDAIEVLNQLATGKFVVPE